MSKLCRNGRSVSTELTWKEKNPITYLYTPSKDVKELIKMVKNEGATGARRQRQRK